MHARAGCPGGEAPAQCTPGHPASPRVTSGADPGLLAEGSAGVTSGADLGLLAEGSGGSALGSRWAPRVFCRRCFVHVILLFPKTREAEPPPWVRSPRCSDGAPLSSPRLAPDSAARPPRPRVCTATPSRRRAARGDPGGQLLTGRAAARETRPAAKAEPALEPPPRPPPARAMDTGEERGPRAPGVPRRARGRRGGRLFPRGPQPGPGTPPLRPRGAREAAAESRGGVGRAPQAARKGRLRRGPGVPAALPPPPRAAAGARAGQFGGHFPLPSSARHPPPRPR